MADLLRKQIRDAVVTAVTGLTTTGANVFQNRVHNMPDSKLPCILVQTESDSMEFETLSEPRRERHDLTLSIEAVVKEASETTAENSLDLICKEVVIAMDGAAAIQALVKDFRLGSTQFSRSGEGDQPIVSAQMLWSFEYHVREGIPDMALN